MSPLVKGSMGEGLANLGKGKIYKSNLDKRSKPLKKGRLVHTLLNPWKQTNVTQPLEKEILLETFEKR